MLKSNEGNFPVYNGGISHSGYYNQYNAEENTIAISQGGASAGFVNFVREKFWAGAHCFTVVPKTQDVNKKFLYYALKNSQSAIMKVKRGAGIPGLSKKELLKFPVEIPPRAEQERIVAILDRFETLVNDLSVGLPAELAARRRQYEYYRDRLLTFQPLEQKP